MDLKPGQMLLYESAKCPHGRVTALKGDWYASVFVDWYAGVEASWCLWSFHAGPLQAQGHGDLLALPAEGRLAGRAPGLGLEAFEMTARRASAGPARS